ncbi:MAG: right-handed parallel beta-helix repeat-containing protein [Pyrinomonadaceae bacterium]
MILSSFIALVPEAHAALTPSGPIVINGQNGTVVTGLKITSTTGDCVQIINSTNITIKESEIGPCNGRGIRITGGSNNHVYDNYIHVEKLASGCCDTRDGVLIDGSGDSVDIQGNVIAYAETNIAVVGGGSTDISVIGNFLLNPRGPFPRGQHLQMWGTSGNPAANVTASNNYALSSTNTGTYLYPDVQEDAFNFGFMSGITVQDNYVVGGHSPSGCGILIDQNANGANISNNKLANTGQCGIGVGGGSNHTVSGNKVLNLTPVAGGGNTAIYVWDYHATGTCGPVTVSNNIADELKPDMVTHSGYWNGGGCGTVTLTNNTFNQAAYNMLYPMASTNPPPSIPVQPKNCVANSPYTTNTSLPLCDTSVASDTTPPSAPTNLAAAPVSSSQINLSWTASTDNVGVQGYKVYRNGVQIPAVTSGNSYSHTGLSPSTTYYYTVSAFDAAGNTSAQSNSASATTKTSVASGAVNVSVALSSGDAEEQQSTGRMHLNSSDLELTEDPGKWGSTAPRQVVAMRFANITIPKRATITNAYIQFTAKEQTWTKPASLILRAQASDSSAVFTTTAFNLSSRPLTSASVSWSPVVWSVVGEANTKERTPNLASVIQEVVNRSGWISGSSIAVIVKGSGHRTAWAYDGSTSRAPLLHIEFAY